MLFLSLFLSSCEEEQRDILFHFISFEVVKIKAALKLRIMLYFSSNKRSFLLLSPPEYTPVKKDFSSDISPGPIFPGYFCLIESCGACPPPLCKSRYKNTFDMKLGTVILCNVTKNMVQKNSKLQL